MAVPSRVHSPGHKHGIRVRLLESFLHSPIVIFQPFAAPDEVLAILDIIQVDSGRQIAIAVLAVGSNAGGTIADAGVIIAVK